MPGGTPWNVTLELKAAVSNFGPSADYPANHRQSRSALVVSAAYAF